MISLPINKKIVVSAIVILVAALVFVASITKDNSFISGDKEVPHEGKWGIYVLDLETEKQSWFTLRQTSFRVYDLTMLEIDWSSTSRLATAASA